MNRWKLIAGILALTCLSTEGYGSSEDMNKELMRTMLSTFLGVNDLRNALAVVKKAIQLYPEDVFWWQWYAKISIWLGNVNDATEAYIKLLQLDPSKENIKEALNLFISAKRYDIAVDLFNKHSWLVGEFNIEELFTIYTSAGRARDFIDFMERLYSKVKNPDSLYYIALAEFRYGDYTKAIRYLERLKTLRPLRLREVLLLSDVYISYKKLDEAYRVLKDSIYAVEEGKREEVVEFYKRLSYLGWNFRDIETSAKASLVLDALGEALADHYRVLYTHYSLRKEYEKAVEFAKKGYEKTKDDELFILMVEGFVALERWRDALGALEKYERNKLLKNPYLLSLYIRSLYITGHQKRGRDFIIQNLSREPNPQLLSTAIYLATGFYDRELVNYILRNFSREEERMPKEFAFLYLSLQQGEKARALIEKLPEKDLEDLILYSFALYTLGRSDEALYIRSMVARRLQGREVLKDKELLRLYLMSGIGILPAVKLQDALKTAPKSLDKRVWQDIYLSYLFAMSFYEKAEREKNINRLELKPWMELSLALRNNDKDRIQKLLQELEIFLPHRDVVEAYRRLGYNLKAIEQAQKGLENNPEDALVYEQLRQLATDHANQVQVEASFRDLEKTKYSTYALSFRWALDERWRVLFSSEGGFLFSTGPNFRNLPSSYHYQTLTIRRMTNSGYYQAGIYSGNSLASFTGFHVGASRRLFRIDNINLSLYYNRPATENLISSLALLKRGVSFSVYESITPRVGVSSSLDYSTFFTQKGSYVGQGFSVYSEAFYKLRYAYPDYTFRLFTAGGFYKEERQRAELLRLYTYQNPKVLPSDNLTIGLGFNFGINLKEMLSRPLLPFLDAEAYYNTKMGAGYSLSLGLSGRVYGRDLLTIGLRGASNFRNTGGPYREFFTRYKSLF